MASFKAISLLLAAAGALALPAPQGSLEKRQSGPIVTLDYGTFQGKSSGGIDSFLGIPFASPPSNSNRLYPPTPPPKYTGVQNATQYGPSCPSQSPTGDQLAGVPSSVLATIEALPVFQQASMMSEDCLTINVQRPAGTPANANLPILFWIYGGGFEFGGTSMYDGSPIVSRSVQTGQPMIFISANYRVSGFGFLPGKEVKAAKVGNLGLLDQRFALQWVQKYAALFGGNTNHVTIWGESAGSISVALQMVTNGGNTQGLFHAGWMTSGSPIPVGDITNGQAVYDTVVQKAGCSAAPDTLQCLRLAPYSVFKAATDSVPSIFSYESLHLAYLPRVDGVFLTDDPQKLVLAGQYARIPFVNGDNDDEGTLFSLTLLNITTDDQATTYFKQNYAPNATPAEIAQVAALYPSDPRQGSPYNTSYLNALSPQYKRLASAQGDLVFQAPRRFFFNYTYGVTQKWTYNNKRLKLTPALGSFHASDLVQYFYTPGASPMTQARDYLCNFVSTFNPNTGKIPLGTDGIINWPVWDNQSYSQLQYNLDGSSLSIVPDTYRKQQMEVLTQLSLKYPI